MFDQTPSPSATGLLYAILLHGGGIPDQPEFVDIVFPDRECQHYIDRLDIKNRFPMVFNPAPTATEELVPDNLDVQLRPAAQRKSGA